MRLFKLIDTVFRDRDSLYAQITPESAPAALLRQLLWLFVVTAGVYGLAMGSFRLLHPEFFFSDYEISLPDKQVLRGKVAGLDPEKAVVYTEKLAEPLPETCQVRFNVSQPSERLRPASLANTEDYCAMTLPADATLKEADVWKIPLQVMWKVPALFVITLLLCAPALYVLNLAFNMKLHFLPVLVLMSLALAATGTMLAVFAPIAGLFSVVTESYHFMKVFHLIVFALAGAFGVKVLAEGLLRFAGEGVGVRRLLMSWLVLYCLVGGQMAWTLKPFLGTPYIPATPPFRIESGNIFVSTFGSLKQVGK
jgi:hypothetical protein